MSSMHVWSIIIIIHYFRLAAWHPRGETHYIYGIFSIRNQFIPWLILVFFVIGHNVYFAFAIIIVGVLQERVYREMLIHFPYVFYVGLEALVPRFIKKNRDFVKVREV